MTTHVTADRVDAGEPVDEIAADYGLERAALEQAMLYERAA